MRRAISFWLPINVVSEANGRDHWAAKARRAKGQRTTTRIATRNAAAIAVDAVDWPILVILTRLKRKGQRDYDDDNLRSAFKAMRDGVADAFGMRDNDERISWEYSQLKDPRGGVQITIMAVRL